ncbi:MAG: hypothetical protein BGO98_41650 [Myxococcales bacterium 68-20]|nr:MAG: hypothetical protein BGO98_41650 [Myxococcales bacterium 68-20]
MTPRELFDGYAPFIWRTLKYQGVAERDLDDITQEVFLIIFRKVDELDSPPSMRPWIYGICVRVASDYRKRARHRHEVLVSDAPESTTEATPSSEAERVAAKRQLTEMIQRLDEDKRAVLVLHEIENIPMNEVALIVDCPVKTAYSRLAAARKHLTTMLSKANRSEK